MKHCPITYEVISDKELYSSRGLRLLSPRLKNLLPLKWNAQEQREEALARSEKLSIQGVQMKISAILNIQKEQFELVNQNGKYILKPQSLDYPELPENEAITMFLAGMIGIDVPLSGLIYAKDNTMTYFIRRFDRGVKGLKYSLEDFAQLTGANRNTKYASSMEKVVSIIQKFCTFPQLEMIKLFKLVLFNFLIGNEDAHLKNFSLITTSDNQVKLSPAYDLLNSAIVLKTKNEIALPLRGKTQNLIAKDFFDYFAKDRLGLNEKVIVKIINEFRNILPRWSEFLAYSFLSKNMQDKYIELINSRISVINL